MSQVNDYNLLDVRCSNAIDSMKTYLLDEHGIPSNLATCIFMGLLMEDLAQDIVCFYGGHEAAETVNKEIDAAREAVHRCVHRLRQLADACWMANTLDEKELKN